MRAPLPLHTRILIGMSAGAVLGIAANALFGGSPALTRLVNEVVEPAGRLFLRLIMMVVIPLVVAAIMLGIAELGDVRRLGRVGARTLLYTVLLSAVSVLIGVGLANLVRPGERMSPETRQALIETTKNVSSPVKAPAEPKKGLWILVDLFPENPVDAMARAFQGEMLAVMVFALVLGVATTLVERGTADPLLKWLEALFAATMKVIAFAMWLAPWGVAALLFTMTARVGGAVLLNLGLYVATVLVGLALHQFGTYSLVLRLGAGTSPAGFFRRLREVMLTAFSTSSSNATLPTTLRVAEENLGIPRPIASFVLTLGSTLNQNGTALYEGITVLFLAQFYGVPLTLGAQVTVVLLSILAGVGTAGVPGGSLPLVMAVLVTVGVPAEGILVIYGVDRLLDMCRTVVNVTGDVTVAACVARSERAFEAA